MHLTCVDCSLWEILEPPAPAKAVVNPFAIERPHAAPHLLERQGSFRGLSQLNQSSPFKRQMSLRIGDLPSTVERQQNSLSNEAPSYKSNLIVTPGKHFFVICRLAHSLPIAAFYRPCSSTVDDPFFCLFVGVDVVFFLLYCNVSDACFDPIRPPYRKSSASSSSQSSPYAAIS